MEQHPRINAKANLVLRFYESLHPDLNRSFFMGLRDRR
jgi:hypothetical protein